MAKVHDLEKPSTSGETSRTFGQRFREQRLGLGLFQREVAERIGVDVTTVRN